MKIAKGKEKEYQDWYNKNNNKEYGYDGDGVVNPAIIGVNTKL